MNRVRSFISIDIEEPQVLSQVENIKEDLRSTGADLKLVQPQNIHITLIFLGEIEAITVEQVKDAVKTVDFTPFNLKLRGARCFNRRRPRVIWIGGGEGAEEVHRLHGELQLKLAPLGFKPEKKRFTCHATISRVRSGRNRNKLLTLLEKLWDIEIGEMTVRAIKLKRSQLTPQGPIYSVIEEHAASNRS